MEKTLDIKEGLGTFKIPVSVESKVVPKKSDEVFFNPLQEINRDLSILVIRAYSHIFNKQKLRACEPLCGIGVRSARYLLETPISDLYCNDSNINATNYTVLNIENLAVKAKKYAIFNQDANEFLRIQHLNNNTFDFIDIDPFGSPIPFVQNGINVLGVEGLIAVTSTDLASLAGIYPKALFSKYSLSQFDERIGNIHEIASRTVVSGVQHIGLTINQSLVPILTLYHRHFIRTFLVRYRGVDRVLDETGFLNYCKDCETIFSTEIGKKMQACLNCFSYKIARIGPLYLGPLQNEKFYHQILNDPHIQVLGSKKKILKILKLMKDEIDIRIPWSYDLPHLAKKAGVRLLPMELMIKKLHEKGYEAGQTHFSGSTLKTNAQQQTLLEILEKYL